MRAYVLDRSTLELKGTLEDALSKVVIRRRLWAPDTVAITLNRRKLYASEVQGGRLLVVPEGTPTDPAAGDLLVFLIETVETAQEGSAANDTITALGQAIEGLPRLCLPAAGQAYDPQSAVKAETAMKHYVNVNLGPGAAAARQMPDLTLVADSARGSTVSRAARYQQLVAFLAEIGQEGGLGWKTTATLTSGVVTGFEFDVIEGTDRSASVFFDFDFDTLSRWVEFVNYASQVSLAVVAGQGEGVLREVVTRPAVEPTGWERRETFLDARDVAVGATTLLNARGDGVLAANASELRLEATLHQAGSFKYGVDWFLGDWVEVRNAARGLAYSAQIVEVAKTVTNSDAAAEIVPILGRATLESTSGPSGAADKGMTPGPGTVTYAMIQNVSATDKVLGRASAGAGSIEEIACTAAGRALIDDASASAQRTTLGAVPAAGPDADITVDAAGAAGTVDTFARSGHGHKLATYSSAPPDADATAASAGTSGTAPARGDHRHHGHAQSHDHSAAGDGTALAPVSCEPSVGLKFPSAPAVISSTGDLTLGAAADVPGLTTTFTPSVAEVVIVMVILDFEHTVASTSFSIGELIVDEVAQSPQVLYKNNSATGRATVGQIYVLALSAAAHTIHVHGSRSAASGTQICRAGHSRMLVIRSAQ